MLTTKRKPATVGEILAEEFMRPLGLTQGVGTFETEFDHLAELTGKLADQVVASHKAAA